jgi:glycosyltransferase involved in cell wall biosynthesis
VHPGAIGLSIFHAFGYGLPVVTSDRVEIQMPEFETHRDGINGLLYRHGDAQDLASKLASLLAEDAVRRRMSAAALATVSGSRGRNVEGMVAGFLEAIDFAAARHGKSRV